MSEVCENEKWEISLESTKFENINEKEWKKIKFYKMGNKHSTKAHGK